jgi:hypothetical protein
MSLTSRVYYRSRPQNSQFAKRKEGLFTQMGSVPDADSQDRHPFSAFAETADARRIASLPFAIRASQSKIDNLQGA